LRRRESSQHFPMHNPMGKGPRPSEEESDDNESVGFYTYEIEVS